MRGVIFPLTPDPYLPRALSDTVGSFTRLTLSFRTRLRMTSTGRLDYVPVVSVVHISAPKWFSVDSFYLKRFFHSKKSHRTIIIQCFVKLSIFFFTKHFKEIMRYV